MKRIRVFLALAAAVSLFSACSNDLPLPPYGSITVACSMAYKDSSNSIDVGKIVNAKVWLVKDRKTEEDVGLNMNKAAKTGNYSFTNLQTGTYDVFVVLGENDDEFLFVSKSGFTLACGDNGTKQMPLFDRYLGTLNYRNSFAADTPAIDSGKVTLYKHDTNLEVVSNSINNIPAVTLAGSFPDRYPTFYKFRVSLTMTINSQQMLLFNDAQDASIVYGSENWITIVDIERKVGKPIISLSNGDNIPPKITSGPIITYDYNKDTHVTSAVISWTTDMKATSNVCYSTKQGFTYKDRVQWAPATYDYMADTTEHAVAIPNFTNNGSVPLYFVVVTSDREADMLVSPEIKIPPLTAECANKIAGGRPDIRVYYEACNCGWNGVSNLNIILNWSSVDKTGFLLERAKYPCCYAN